MLIQRIRSKTDLSWWAIFLVALVVTWINFNTTPWKHNGGVIKHDILGYYSYLPAALIFDDLSFKFIDDDPAFFGDKVYLHIAPNGGRYQKMTMGLAFLYLPFFLLGHAAAHITGAEITGYSPPYMFFLQFSSLVYLLIGLLLIRRILKQHFKDWISALVLLALVFGTGILFYTTFEAAMSHTYSFMLFTLFVYLSIAWQTRQTWKNSIWLGLVLGLIVLIRPTNGLIGLFLLLYDVKTVSEFLVRIKLFIMNWKKILALGFFAFVVFFPQMLFWKYNTGQWLFYSYGEEGFFFLKPEILNGLFSYRKGWLLYTPIMTLALAGIFILYRRYRQFFAPILAFAVMNIYVVYSWWCWWYGGSFGSRPMIDSYPLMAVSLAAVISWASNKLSGRVAIIALVILFCLHSIFQTIQYHYGAIHFDSMTKKAYWNSFGRVRAKHPFWDYLQSPDINGAMKGMEITAQPATPTHNEAKEKHTFEAFLSCDYEHITETGKMIYSSDAEILIEGASKLSDEIARSGKFAVSLHRNEQFGSDFQLQVNSGDIYKLAIWKYPANGNGGIAFTAMVESEFYNYTQITSLVDDRGWGKVELEVLVPDTLAGRMKVYLWNPGSEKVYFDDLTIEKVKSGPIKND